VGDALSLLLDLSAKPWLNRGQARPYGNLTPSFDWHLPRELSRREKLLIERRCISLFRSAVKSFAAEGEKAALTTDLVALMVLRHYGVPTRLLDWSRSPYVGAYFAVRDHDGEDGELWTFDEPLYEVEGARQWERWPDWQLTTFGLEEGPDWFVCQFYDGHPGFPRQDAQVGAYSLTAQFNRDHADKIAGLLVDDSRYQRHVIGAGIKLHLRRILRDDYGVWGGSLFPDSAGAAASIGELGFGSPCEGASGVPSWAS
jgi:hypothetical protein